MWLTFPIIYCSNAHKIYNIAIAKVPLHIDTFGKYIIYIIHYQRAASETFLAYTQIAQSTDRITRFPLLLKQKYNSTCLDEA